MHLGWAVTCLADPRGIAELLPDVRPQFFFSPPRLWEKLRAAAISRDLSLSPANIAATVKSAGSVIGCVCAIGDGRPYNVALVTLDPQAAATVADPRAEVAAQIERANEKLARVEEIKRFALLPATGPPAATS